LNTEPRDARAIEHDGTLCSTDWGFRRFNQLKLRNPIEGWAEALSS
jgi:hypothetical protein